MVKKSTTVSISDETINRDLKNEILRRAKPYLTDYQIAFQDGYIFLSVNIRIKKLGHITAHYRFRITDLKFNRHYHTLIATYQENIKSTGGLTQNIMLSALALKSGTFLQNIIDITRVPGIRADEKSCSIQLEQLLNFNNYFLSGLCLEYMDCINGILTLRVNIDL
jgi:hypothetical protein